MIAYTEIVIFLNIFVQVNADEHLFSLFHKDVAKRFDIARQIHVNPDLWHDLRAKNAEYFKLGPEQSNQAKMGYFLHIVPGRRAFQFNRYEGESVVGVPSNVYHLPASEPVLPGHTLLRPTLSALKSAVKFPHLENEEGGGGVYGNPSNLGIRYGGKSDRILYSNNRRMLSKNARTHPSSDSISAIPKHQCVAVKQKL